MTFAEPIKQDEVEIRQRTGRGDCRVEKWIEEKEERRKKHAKYRGENRYAQKAPFDGMCSFVERAEFSG